MGTVAESKVHEFQHDNSFLLNSGHKPTYGVILLNTPFGDYFPVLWEKAQFVVACDGAANRLFERADKHKLFPEVIIGDLDSAKREVMDYYKRQNVKVQREIDQDKTDLMKAIEYILAKPSHSQPDVIVVYGGFHGRFDHLMSHINVLHQYGSAKRIVLLQEGNLVELLLPGHHSIKCNLKERGVACGLMPFTGPALVVSTGLKWNLKHQEMRFGGLLSTSNRTVDDLVTVDTTGPLIWSTAFGTED